MSLGPFLRSPFTDLTGCLINHQHYDSCGDMEMAMMDCLEAYGVDKGSRKCITFMSDFQECVGRKKQTLRVFAMRQERYRQLQEGTRTKKELFAPPPATNSY